MANYCLNRITLPELTKEELLKLKERVVSLDEFQDEYIDFNKIIKRPENILLRGFRLKTLDAFSKYYYENPDNLPQRTLDRIIKNEIRNYPIHDKVVDIQEYIEDKYSLEELREYQGERLVLWYDWSITNWGTKWNSLWTEISELEIRFHTIWNPVSETLFKEFVNILRDIVGERAKETWLYYYEGRRSLEGKYEIVNREVIHDKEYEEESVA